MRKMPPKPMKKPMAAKMPPKAAKKAAAMENKAIKTLSKAQKMEKENGVV